MPTSALTPQRHAHARRRRAAHTRSTLLDSLESRVLLSVSTLHEYRGVNAQDVWDGHNSAADTASWDVNIIREGLFNFDAAALDTATTQADGYWLHGMQNIVNQNANAGDLTIICIPWSQ